MQGIVQSLLKCTARHEGRELMAEVHQTFSRCHVNPRSLASETMRLGFFCPKIVRDAQNIAQSCEGGLAEFQADCPHLATVTLGHRHRRPHPNSSWELEVCLRRSGIFHQMDRGEGIKHSPKFYWQNIICRYRVPSEITMDNVKQFDSQQFRYFVNQSEPKSISLLCITLYPTT